MSHAAAIDPTFQFRALNRPTLQTAANTEGRMTLALDRLNDAAGRLQGEAGQRGSGEQAFADLRDRAVQQMRGTLAIFRKSVQRERPSFARSEATLKIVSLETTLARVERMSAIEWADHGSREVSTAIARLGDHG